MLENELDDISLYTCKRDGLEQRLLCADLEEPDTHARIRALLPSSVRLVYSDPPWNPGNATYWRTHADMSKCESYCHFMDAFTSVIDECIKRGALDVFVEQSIKPEHNGLFLDAMRRNVGHALPLLEQWKVYYKAGAKLLPNALFHFGNTRITTSPEGMADEPMTIRVCAGIDAAPGSWVVDQCMGKGTTSRMAHYFGWNAVGVELNQKRLAKTVAWLKRQGYEIKAS